MTKTTTEAPTKADPDELLSELERHESDAREAYERLVRRVGKGQAVAPDDAKAIIRAAGETPAAFRDAVEVIRQRRREDEELAHLPELEVNFVAARDAAAAKRAEIRQAVEALNAGLTAFVVAEDRAERELAALRGREREILARRNHERKAEEEKDRREWEKMIGRQE